MNQKVSVARDKRVASQTKLVRHCLIEPPAVHLHSIAQMDSPLRCHLQPRSLVVSARNSGLTAGGCDLHRQLSSALRFPVQYKVHIRIDSDRPRKHSSVDKRLRSVSTSASKSGRERDGWTKATSYPTKAALAHRIAANRRSYRGIPTVLTSLLCPQAARPRDFHPLPFLTPIVSQAFSRSTVLVQ